MGIYFKSFIESKFYAFYKNEATYEWGVLPVPRRESLQERSLTEISAPSDVLAAPVLIPPTAVLPLQFLIESGNEEVVN